MQIFKKKNSEPSLTPTMEELQGKSKKEKMELFVKKFLEASGETKEYSFLYISNPNQSDVCGIKVPKDKSVDFTFIEYVKEDFGVEAVSVTEDGCLFIQFPHF